MYRCPNREGTGKETTDYSMSENDLPISDPVFVLKNGERLGPYGVDEIFDLLENGDLAYEDVCLREGASECQRLRDILDWERNEEEASKETDDSPEEEFSKEEPVPQAPPRSSRFLYIGYPSLITFPIPLFLLVGGVVGGIWLSFYGEWVPLAGFLIAILSFGYISFQRSLQKYTISPRRVEVTTGFIAKSSREALIADIRAINVVRRGIAGMLGVGTVEFNTTGDDPEVTFHDVWKADRVKSLVRQIQDKD